MSTCWRRLPTRFHPANKCSEPGRGPDDLSTDESRALLTAAPTLQAMAPSLLLSSTFCLLRCRLRQSPVGNCVLAYVMKAVTLLMLPKHLSADPRDPFS